MTDVLKVLGQVAPSATTATTLYTVPDLTLTTVSSLVVCNRSGSGVTYRVSVRVAGAGADNIQYFFYVKSLAANATDTHVIGMTLNQTDVVTVYGSDGNLTFNLFGVETS